MTITRLRRFSLRFLRENIILSFSKSTVLIFHRCGLKGPIFVFFFHFNQTTPNRARSGGPRVHACKLRCLYGTGPGARQIPPTDKIRESLRSTRYRIIIIYYRRRSDVFIVIFFCFSVFERAAQTKYYNNIYNKITRNYGRSYFYNSQPFFVHIFFFFCPTYNFLQQRTVAPARSTTRPLNA